MAGSDNLRLIGMWGRGILGSEYRYISWKFVIALCQVDEVLVCFLWFESFLASAQVFIKLRQMIASYWEELIFLNGVVWSDLEEINESLWSREFEAMTQYSRYYSMVLLALPGPFLRSWWIALISESRTPLNLHFKLKVLDHCIGTEDFAISVCIGFGWYHRWCRWIEVSWCVLRIWNVNEWGLKVD